MCINPQPLIVQGTTVEVPCHKCWQCKEDRVDDIVGRCIAEQKVSRFTYTVTLTYGGDAIDGKVPLRARLLDFRDVSLYLKRLRKLVPVRYVAAGEYGERHGRGHFHLVIFTNGNVPELQLEKRINHAPWPHGYSYWEEATYQRMRYACAYVLKNIDQQGTRRERLYGASRFPPLGAEYFRQLAEQHVRQGLSPQDGFYTFPEVRKHDGTTKFFRLTRRSSERYCAAFIDAWERANEGRDDWPQSDYIDAYIDQKAKETGLRPGDWLEERRFQMKRVKWDGLDALPGISTGTTADRAIRETARRRETIDDRLRTMGNRKGIGWEPTSNPSLRPK